jgi:hypothetical protein
LSVAFCTKISDKGFHYLPSAIGLKKLVAGQEDLIMNIMFNLRNKKNNIKIQ